MRRLPALLGILAAFGTEPASACAVPTRIEIRNETGQTVRQVMFSDDPGAGHAAPRLDGLASTGLAPGDAVTLTMPSCIGIYVLTAVLADGTRRQYRDLDARRIRALALR